MRIYVLANSRTCVCEFPHLRLRIPAPAFGGACIGNGLTAVQTAGRSLLHTSADPEKKIFHSGLLKRKKVYFCRSKKVKVKLVEI